MPCRPNTAKLPACKAMPRKGKLLEAWGNFEPASVRKLKDAGYVIGFYSCSEGNLQGRMGNGIQRDDHQPHFFSKSFS